MRTILLKLVLIVISVSVTVNAIPQGKVEEEEKPIPGEGTPFPNFSNGPLIFRRVKEELPQLIKNITNIDWSKNPNFQLLNRTGFFPQKGLTVDSIYNTLLSGVHSLYQDILNRQQAFINLLTCGNCLNDGWNAIMDVALTVPELEWVYKPSQNSPATFFTAVHQNGVVTGIGGSIVNDKPVAEYAFGNDGIVQNLPNRNKKGEAHNKPQKL